MDEEVDRLVIGVRADTQAFARDVATLRATLDGPFGTGVARAGQVLDATLARAVRTGKLGFDDLKRVALSALAEIAAQAIRTGLGGASAGQGRSASAGLVGLIAVAFGRHDVPRDYDLRTADEARWMAELDARLTRMSGPLQPGQVLLMQAGPAQLHLGLWTGHSLIHAHAGLRQIVETPGPPAWPILGQWQSAQEDPWRH